MLRIIQWLGGLGGRALRRDAGVYCANFELPGGWSADVIQAHTIPPIPRMLTRIEERLTAAVVRDHYPVPGKDECIVRLVCGDFNTYPNPKKLYEKFASLGYTALIPLNTETCSLGDTHPLLAKIFRSKLHLDIAMLAIPRGFELVDLSDTGSPELKANQIGYRTKLVKTASDHWAVRTTLLPPKRLPEEAAPRVPIRRVTEPHWPMEWPHYDRKAFRMLAKVLRQGWRARFVRRDPTLSDNGALMRRINGQGSERLADKYSFINLVASMQEGYRVPRQMLATRGLSDEQIRSIAKNFANTERLICKPVRGAGGAIHVSNLGYHETTIPEWGPEYAERYPNRIRNFDRFMRRFLTDLQTEVGQRLPTLCFDIGIINPAALDGQYDYERIKPNVVFFECQMPFTMINYARQSRKNPYGIPRQRRPQEDFVPFPHPLYRP